jgi:hypothetical protein
VTLGQLILDLPHRATHGAEDFLVSGCSDRRFARTPSALVAADAENSHAEDFPALGIQQHFHEALRLAACASHGSRRLTLHLAAPWTVENE